MLKLASDVNVHGSVAAGLSDDQDVDFVRFQDSGLSSRTPDQKVLEWAASQSRVLLTNDRATMINYARQRVKLGKPMPGLIVLPRCHWDGRSLEQVQLIAAVCDPSELADRIIFLPLKPGDLPGRVTR